MALAAPPSQGTATGRPTGDRNGLSKGLIPLRACLLQGGAFHLSDLLHTKSIISCCPYGLRPHPIPIAGAAATISLNVAVGA